MLHSWTIVRQTCRTADCSWSRLFHTSRSYLSNFRPWRGQDTQRQERDLPTRDKNRLRFSQTERKWNEQNYQDKSDNRYRFSTVDKGRDMGFNSDYRTKPWRAQSGDDRSHRQTFDHRRQRQSFRDSERPLSEDGNQHRSAFRYPSKDQQRLEQNQRHRPDYGYSERPHYRPRKMHKRVLTEEELREEEEFKRLSHEEDDASDRFGDYEYGVRAGYKTKQDQYETDQRMRSGSRVKHGQYRSNERLAQYDDQRENEQFRSNDRFVQFGDRMKHKQYPRERTEASRRNWSETFGTISLEDQPALGDVLFGEELAPRSADDCRPAEERFTDEDDGVIDRRHIPLSRRNRKHIPHWYARRIEKLSKQGMVKEALDLFEKEMIEKDRVKPTYYEFGLMITLLGRVGYVQKAFNLFQRMRQMDLVPEPKVYSSLFNACAKSSMKDIGLEHAHKLRYHMIEQGIEPTFITYQAMISAFGMCGDTEMAFSLLDEVLLKCRPSENLLNSALVACISDKEAGFRHALLVWRKLVKRGVKPDLASYNLLLRAIKECGVGPLTRDNNLLLIEAENQEGSHHHGNIQEKKKIVSSMQMKVDQDNQDDVSFVEVIEAVEPSDKMKDSLNEDLLHGSVVNAKNIQAAVDGKNETVDIGRLSEVDKTPAGDSVKHWWEYDLGQQSGTQLGSVVTHGVRRSRADILQLDQEMMPNILNPHDRSLQVVSLGQLATAEDRLSLCGGVKGYLSSIEMEGVKPDVVTFIQLVGVANKQEEDEVLEMMSLYNVEPDIDYFNHLIKKKSSRSEFQAALDVLELIEEHGLVPNIQTYGCWAAACSSWRNGTKLLQDMEAAKLQPNTTIFTSLVKNSYNLFKYKTWLLNQMRLLSIPADTVFINMLEKQISKMKQVIVRKEKGEAIPAWAENPNFENGFWKFMDFYNCWVTQISFEKEEHPWAEFQDKSDRTDKEWKESKAI